LEEIDFRENKVLKQYFYEYYYHQFYKINKENMNQNTSLEYYERFWKSIFEINNNKNKNVLNILVEIYNIYDKSINLQKNILEIV
jgi:predicted DNA-binding ribbon-helix-helix protein